MAPSECPHLILQALAGPMAAATASTITNPMDVVRARVQVQATLCALHRTVMLSKICCCKGLHTPDAFFVQILKIYSGLLVFSCVSVANLSHG